MSARVVRGPSAPRLLGFLAVVAGAARVLTGCVVAPPYVPVQPNPPPRSYEYRWDPPQQGEADPIDLTVVVVKPDFGDEPDALVREPLYRQFVRGFSKSMAADLDRVLVAKGIHVTGPYDTWDDITYPDKKGSHLAITPRLFLSVTVQPASQGLTRTPNRRVGKESEFLIGRDGQVTQYRPADLIEVAYDLHVQGQIVFELREPLSKEKLWVKKLDLEPASFTPCVDQYAFQGSFGPYGELLDWSRGELLYNGREHALVRFMEARYPEIMGKLWTYLDSEEMSALKAQVDEIRERKRY